MKMLTKTVIFAVSLLYYQRIAAGYLNERYIRIRTGKTLSVQIRNVTSKSLHDCAGKCIELAPQGSCDIAGFNKSSNSCQLGSQALASIQDVPDDDSVVMVFLEMCGISEAPVHGSVEYSSNRHTAYFTCHPGYYLSGNTSIPCNNGQLVGTVPACLALHSDCCDVRTNYPSAPSGLYGISMTDNTVTSVYCDMDTTCGGWTVIQNRFDGSVNFTETFSKYEYGFGSVEAEHWLGLRYIKEIAAKAPTTLRIDLEAADGTKAYEQHTKFILSAAPNYTLSLNSTGTGTAGYDPGIGYNSGQNFFTVDRDNSFNCSHGDRGGWWYRQCAWVNLNGRYMPPGDASTGEAGLTYWAFKNHASLKKSKMMISRCCA